VFHGFLLVTTTMKKEIGRSQTCPENLSYTNSCAEKQQNLLSYF